MQIVNLSYATHNVDESVQLGDHEYFYHTLRPVFQHLFKLDCFQFKCYLALIKLLLKTSLLVCQSLLQNFVHVRFTTTASVLLRAHKLLQTLPHLDRAHLIVVEAQSLN